MASGPFRSLLLALPEPQAFAAALASGADAVILDLAGDPSPEAARERAAACLDRRRAGQGGPPVFVRVHPLASGRLDADLDVLVPARPEGVLLPQSEGAADVLRLSAMLAAREALAGLDDGAIRILAGAADTPAGVLHLAGYREAGPRLAGLVLGRAPLSAALGMTAAEAQPLSDPLRLARTLLVLAAAAAGLPAIDAPFPDNEDADGLAVDSEAGRRDGYAGKVAIHPAQVPAINRIFSGG